MVDIGRTSQNIPSTGKLKTLVGHISGGLRPMNYRPGLFIVLSLISMLILGFRKKCKNDFTVMIASCFEQTRWT
jgi:hypothetical protein